MAVRAMSSSSFRLPDLPYDFNALEPVISAEIMQLHHQKHHNAYVTNLNVAMDKLDDAKVRAETCLLLVCSALRLFGTSQKIEASNFHHCISLDRPRAHTQTVLPWFANRPRTT